VQQQEKSEVNSFATLAASILKRTVHLNWATGSNARTE